MAPARPAAGAVSILRREEPAEAGGDRKKSRMNRLRWGRAVAAAGLWLCLSAGALAQEPKQEWDLEIIGEDPSGESKGEEPAYPGSEGDERLLTGEEADQFLEWSPTGPEAADPAQEWKQKGYDREVGPEEKEKRPESVIGNSPSWRDYQEQQKSKKL